MVKIPSIAVLAVVVIVCVAAVAIYFVTIPAPEEPEEPEDNLLPLEWNPTRSYNRGPLDVESMSTEQIKALLTEEDKEAVRQMNLKLALQWQAATEETSIAFQTGAVIAAEELGIEVVANNYAEWDSLTEIELVETAMLKNPDYFIVSTVEPEATKTVWRKVADAGIPIVVISTYFPGLEVPEEIISNSTDDSKGTGVCAGYLMAQALYEKYGEYKGKVVTLDWGIEFFVTNQREEGFRQNMKLYPNIEVVGRETFPDPTAVLDTAKAILPRYPDIDGIFVTWTEPCALDVLQAAKELGRTDLIITSVDLSERVAIEIARAEGPTLYGVAGADSANIGVSAVYLIALHALGKEVPQLSTIPTIPVERSNLIEAWDAAYGSIGKPLPPEVLDFLGG
ncbi:MAG: substrate-binding domain-containing protein [Elusimicrobiota bacterium]|nr:substrate-binding domain-containing protein [Elusimicrobiota bacterium]